ncbi:MAG: peptide ABC transporter substrate-binding protein [Gemmatimonadaceae bacterium]
MLPHRWRFARACILGLSALDVVACSTEVTGDNEGGGTVIVAVAADADFLLPPVINQLVGKQIADQLFAPLAAPPASMNTVGDAGFEPRLARSWTWAPDSLSIAFSIDPRARWHDGQPVRAEDVRFSIALLKDPVVASRHASALEGVDSASVQDSLTAVVWFNRRSPEQFFSLVYGLPVVPAHLLASVPRDKMRESDFAQNPVGSGRFRFRRWVKGSLIELVADTANFLGRPSLDRVIWSISPDPTALWSRLVTEEADMVEMLRGDALAGVAASSTIRLVPYQGRSYTIALFNQRDPANRQRPHPLLGDAALRRALVMAVDRKAIVKNVYDTLAYPSIGPVVRAQWTADTSIAMLPYDVAAAKALLDSLGWVDADGNGVREKRGRPLAFALLSSSSSTAQRQSVVLLQAQWKEVGAQVSLDEMEFNAYVERMSSGRFDVTMQGLYSDPSPSILKANYGAPSSPRAFGANYSGYSSPVVDALLDSVQSEFNTIRSKSLYQRAYARIIDDAAAIFLYEPKMVAGINRRIDTGPLSAAGWWTTMASWKIAPDKRIARDRIPLGAAAAPESVGTR